MKRWVLLISILTLMSAFFCGCAAGVAIDPSEDIAAAEETDDASGAHPTVQPDATKKPQASQTPEAAQGTDEARAISALKPTDGVAALYYGFVLDKSDFLVDIFSSADSIINPYFKEKYETSYQLYSDGARVGEAEGVLQPEGLDAYWIVRFPPEAVAFEIAIAAGYDPYPREMTIIDSDFPAALDSVTSWVNSAFDENSALRELASVDLDGDGRTEYLAYFVDEDSCFIAKCLLDSEFDIISYLTVFKEQNSEFREVVEDYSISNSGEIIDINEDGIMEIAVVLPSYEGFYFELFRYDRGNFDGDYVNRCGFGP